MTETTTNQMTALEVAAEITQAPDKQVDEQAVKEARAKYISAGWHPMEEADYELKLAFVGGLLDRMQEKGKNIPLTKAEIELLPLGFTPTSIYPTKSVQQHRSKYFLPKQYSHLQNLLNLKSLINKINLEVS